MEDVRAVYEKPCNPVEPTVGREEKPVSLHDDVRPPIPAAPGRIAKRDNEYKRCGTANVFCAVEPKAGRHFTQPTPNRSASEFARALGTIVSRYPQARTIHLVMDNLNIHGRKSLTDYFRREEGRGDLESAHRSLHAEARELAEPSGNRNQPLMPAMSGPAEDSNLGHLATGSSRLEPQGQSRSGQDQLAIHPQEGACKVRLQKESFKAVGDLAAWRRISFSTISTTFLGGRKLLPTPRERCRIGLKEK
jgi:hypothetical protein